MIGPPDLDAIAEWARVASLPRLTILGLIATRGPMTIPEIIEWTGRGRTRIDADLRIMVAAKMLRKERRGNAVAYLVGPSPTPPALRAFADALASLASNTTE